MKHVALLVFGCDYKGTRYQLGGCINDAVDFSSTVVGLSEKEGIDVDLTMCLDNGSGRRPTKATITEKLRSVITAVNRGRYDSMIFYFAGHGVQTADRSGDESDRKDESLVTADLQLLLDDELYLLIARLKSHCEATFIFDCCHSGTVLDLPKVPIGGGGSKGGHMNPRAQIMSIAACAEWGKSIEKHGRGLFTSSLCNLLRQRGLGAKIGPMVSTIRRYLDSQQTDMVVTASCSQGVAVRRSSIVNVRSVGRNRGISEEGTRSFGAGERGMGGARKGGARAGKKKGGFRKGGSGKKKGGARKGKGGRRRNRGMGINRGMAERGENPNCTNEACKKLQMRGGRMTQALNSLGCSCCYRSHCPSTIRGPWKPKVFRGKLKALTSR